jgi:hypothetical protein
MTLYFYGLILIALFLFVVGIRKAAPLQPALIRRLGGKTIRTLSLVLFCIPLVIMLGAVTLIFTTWHTDPLLRFAHLLWVLGLWMIGIVAIIIFLPTFQLKLARFYSLLVSFLLSVPLAIYSTPLSRFQASSTTSITIYAALVIGLAAVVFNLVILYRVWQTS